MIDTMQGGRIMDSVRLAEHDGRTYLEGGKVVLFIDGDEVAGTGLPLDASCSSWTDEDGREIEGNQFKADLFGVSTDPRSVALDIQGEGFRVVLNLKRRKGNRWSADPVDFRGERHSFGYWKAYAWGTFRGGRYEVTVQVFPLVDEREYRSAAWEAAVPGIMRRTTDGGEKLSRYTGLLRVAGSISKGSALDDVSQLAADLADLAHEYRTALERIAAAVDWVDEGERVGYRFDLVRRLATSWKESEAVAGGRS